MRIDLPGCPLRSCRYHNDGNCTDTRHYENCVLRDMIQKEHEVLKEVEKIYADIEEKVELARQRVYDTPTNSPCYMRYVTQEIERKAFKEMLYNTLTSIKEKINE